MTGMILIVRIQRTGARWTEDPTDVRTGGGGRKDAGQLHGTRLPMETRLSGVCPAHGGAAGFLTDRTLGGSLGVQPRHALVSLRRRVIFP